MDSAILMFLSRYNPRNTHSTRYTEMISKKEYRRFTGLQTNDAPCKYLLRRAGEDGHPVSTILCLVTMEDLRTIPEESLPRGLRVTARERAENPQAVSTSVTCFRKMVRRYARRAEGIPAPEIILIPYDCDPEAPGFDPNETDRRALKRQKIPAEQRAARVYGQIAHWVSRNGLRHLYVDFTGGMRDTSFLLMELSRFLNLLEIPCEEIIYSNFEEKKILSLQSAYAMFPVLSGIRSFLNTGNARGLQKACGLSCDSQSVEGRLLANLVAFSQAMSLCDMDPIHDLYSAIIENLQELESCPTDAETDINLLMLKDFSRQIREKFYIPPAAASGTSFTSASYFGLMQWCLDNDLLQQALTLYVEKVPEYLLDSGLIKANPDSGSSLPNKTAAVGEFGRIYSLLATDEALDAFAGMLQYLKNSMSEEFSGKEDLTEAIRKAIAVKGRGCGQAVTRFQDLIRQNFRRQDRSWVSNGDITVYGKTYKRTRLDNFIEMCSKTPLLQHYCVYHDPEAFAARSQEALRMEALRRLEAGRAKILRFTNLDTPVFYQVMLYYFAVVSLRNQVNHANYTQSDESIAFCTARHVYTSDVISYPMVRDSLQKAVRFMLDLSKNPYGKPEKPPVSSGVIIKKKKKKKKKK